MIHSFLAEADPALPVTLGISAVVGLFVWAMGRKVARPAIAVCGLAMGAVGAFALAHRMLQPGDQLMFVWVGGGGIAGLLLAWLMFRPWMAISLAALFAMAAPALNVIWVGISEATASDAAAKSGTVWGFGEVADSGAAKDSAAKDRTTPAAPTTETKSPFPGLKLNGDDDEFDPTLPKSLSPVEAAKPFIQIDPENVEKAKRTVMDTIRRVYDYQAEQIRAWWADLKPDGQRNLTITAAIAGLAGALVGFVLPYFSASIQTSLVGGAMLLSGVRGLLATYAPEQTRWLPQEPRPLLITLSLITAVGVLVQWSFWRRSADK